MKQVKTRQVIVTEWGQIAVGDLPAAIKAMFPLLRFRKDGGYDRRFNVCVEFERAVQHITQARYAA